MSLWTWCIYNTYTLELYIIPISLFVHVVVNSPMIAYKVAKPKQGCKLPNVLKKCEWNKNQKIEPYVWIVFKMYLRCVLKNHTEFKFWLLLHVLAWVGNALCAWICVTQISTSKARTHFLQGLVQPTFWQWVVWEHQWCRPLPHQFLVPARIESVSLHIGGRKQSASKRVMSYDVNICITNHYLHIQYQPRVLDSDSAIQKSNRISQQLWEVLGPVQSSKLLSFPTKLLSR